MQKYRRHTQHEIQQTKMHYDKLVEKFSDCKCSETIEKYGKAISDLNSMMTAIFKEGELENAKLIQEIARLKTENDTLRKLLSTFEDGFLLNNLLENQNENQNPNEAGDNFAHASSLISEI